MQPPKRVNVDNKEARLQVQARSSHFAIPYETLTLRKINILWFRTMVRDWGMVRSWVSVRVRVCLVLGLRLVRS